MDGMGDNMRVTISGVVLAALALYFWMHQGDAITFTVPTLTLP